MGLFNRTPKVVVCDLCGRADVEGCGSLDNHVQEIRGEEPAWLPHDLRAQAQGEYTWLCLRCNSYPAVKWPHRGGAWAGLSTHLGQVHHVGRFSTMSGALPRIDMVAVR